MFLTVCKFFLLSDESQQGALALVLISLFGLRERERGRAGDVYEPLPLHFAAKALYLVRSPTISLLVSSLVKTLV